MADENRFVGEHVAVRQRQRAKLNTPVCLVIEKPGNVALISARFRDISDDGAAIFAGVELAIDSEIQIEFTAPFDTDPMRVRAIVRNRRQYVYGIEFLPRDGEEERILRMLKSVLLSTGTLAPGSVDDRRWT